MARPRSKYPPQTPAERQAKCRAIKRGEQVYLPDMTDSEPLEDRPLPNATNPNHTLAWLRKQPAAMQQSIASQLGLPAPADSGGQSAALPAPELPATRALPAPQQAIELRPPDRPCRGGAPFALATSRGSQRAQRAVVNWHCRILISLSPMPSPLRSR